jgi:hypothetical protein
MNSHCLICQSERPAGGGSDAVKPTRKPVRAFQCHATAPVAEAADYSTTGGRFGAIMRAVAPSINPVESNPPSASGIGPHRQQTRPPRTCPRSSARRYSGSYASDSLRDRRCAVQFGFDESRGSRPVASRKGKRVRQETNLPGQKSGAPEDQGNPRKGGDHGRAQVSLGNGRAVSPVRQQSRDRLPGAGHERLYR